MNLTAAELQLLRSQPHRTNLYLSIYEPQTVMTARVTGSYDFGDIEISYYDSSGSYLNLYPDMTVLIGTQSGQDDVGRIRLRAATGTYVTIAESPNLMQNGYYLTFLDYITVEAVYPRIIQDPNDAEDVIFYKDYDIPYSNQNEIYGTFPCAGPHRAAFLNSGTATLYYTATGTYNVAGSALTYSWLFEGGTPTGSTSLTPGNVTYSTPGHYTTRLRVTAANGAVDDTYRYVSIYDRPEAGANVPVLKWELNELSGSRSEGGYTASFRVRENIGEVLPNALVVIFAETWYGGTKTAIGGNAQGNQSIVFVGYIISDSIQFNYKESYVEFQVGSVSEIMKNAEGFSVSCESKASPVTWFELQEMTVPKAMYHYLRWHSTVLKTTDFQYTGDDRLVQYFDADRGSLYDAVDSFMRDGLLGAVISDRQGKLWAEINSFGLQAPFTTIPTRFTFHKQDWIGSPTIQERRNSDLSFIELGGIAFYGVGSNAFSALLTAAPSTVPLYHGKSDRNDGLILTSQEALNQTAGHYLAHFNTRFPDINLSLAGNYNNLDITPIEKTYLVIDQNDSVRGKSIQDLPYIVDGMEWSYDPRKEQWRPDVTLLQIATGTAGQTVEIPAVPPDGGYGYPETDLPPLPEFPGGGGGVGPSIPLTVLFHDPFYGFIYTHDFDSANPTYVQWNTNLTSGRYQDANFMFVCPNGAVYVGRAESRSGVQTGHWVARAAAIGQPFVVLYDENNLSGPARYGVFAASFNPEAPETVALVLENNGGGQKIYLGAGSTFSVGATIANENAKGYISYTKGFWLYTSYEKYVKVAPGGGSVVASSNPNVSLLHHRGSSLSEQTIHQRNNGTPNWYIITNYSPSSPQEVVDSNLTQTGISVGTPTNLVMTRYGVGLRGRSADGGFSFSLIPNLPLGNYTFCYAGGDSIGGSRWIAAGAVIRFSPDFGNTWLNREGNISQLGAQTPAIDIVFVPGVTQSTAVDVLRYT
jgi:hypothetical protein